MDDKGNVMQEPTLKMDLLHAVHDALRGMPSIIHKTVLKAIINALLEERPLLEAREEAKALFALLQCPVFAAQRSYTIFAHVLRRAATLPAPERALLPRWFRLLGSERLRSLVRHVAQFVAIRQFPPSGKSLPPPAKSRWWIPAAARVLALVNAANEGAAPGEQLLHFSELYNMALDHVDLLREYYVWQSSPQRFSFCQFPFMLSLAAKRYILTKDSEQQMIMTARRSLAAKASRRLAPQIDIFFLNIRGELKKKLKVSFVGEPGLDMGGLTKEWFLLLVRHIFQPDYGMFVYHKHSRSYWFSTEVAAAVDGSDDEANGETGEDEGQGGGLREYHLIGVLMGLADIARGLSELLAYEGNVEEDMCMSFEVSLEEYGSVRTWPLKPGGENTPVNNENRREYVALYLDWMLRPEEVELLVCGSPTVDLGELRKVTEYDGYRPDDRVICDLWEVLESLPADLQRKFLLFATGSDRVPVGGTGEMSFKVTRAGGDINDLPEAHTCFNQLVLPPYANQQTLHRKLIIAISNAEGFGLE
ncbi:hypothetical protein B566_EDAN001635 [Ephemera danica]|nr:hypothetical protein B566_EDAN001635 [Ephemera danica]